MPVAVMSGPVTAFAFETITVSTVSIAATAATYSDVLTPSLSANMTPRSATVGFLTVESNPIRVRWDGGVPTASVGHLLNAGDTLELIGLFNIKQLKMIRQSGADATVTVTYSRN